MATLREQQSKAKKLLAGWKKEFDSLVKNDRRSPVTHLCTCVLMRNNGINNAKQALQALRERFVDWNEIRVSPVAEVEEAFNSVGTPAPDQKAYALRRFLRDLFSKYIKANLNFDLIDIPEVVIPKEDQTEEEIPEGEEPVSRDSGLPPHLEIAGFVDMERVINQPIPLDPKLIIEKNGIHVCAMAFDDCERAPFSTIWKVALAEKLIEPELDAPAALARIRQIAPDKEMDAFAFYAILFAEANWTKVRADADSLRKKVKGADEKGEAPARKRPTASVSKRTAKAK